MDQRPFPCPVTERLWQILGRIKVAMQTPPAKQWSFNLIWILTPVLLPAQFQWNLPWVLQDVPWPCSAHHSCRNCSAQHLSVSNPMLNPHPTYFILQRSLGTEDGSAMLSCPDPHSSPLQPCQQHPRIIQLGKDLPEHGVQAGINPISSNSLSPRDGDCPSSQSLPVPEHLFHGCTGTLVFLWGCFGFLWAAALLSVSHKSRSPAESWVSLWAALCGLGWIKERRGRSSGFCWEWSVPGVGNLCETQPRSEFSCHLSFLSKAHLALKWSSTLDVYILFSKSIYNCQFACLALLFSPEVLGSLESGGGKSISSAFPGAQLFQLAAFFLSEISLGPGADLLPHVLPVLFLHWEFVHSHSSEFTCLLFPSPR